MPVCQSCGIEVTDENFDQFDEIVSKIVMYVCKNKMQCELNRQLANVKQFKETKMKADENGELKAALDEIEQYEYTGNCYIEQHCGRGRVVVCEPGSYKDNDCSMRSRTSSKWTYIGRFKNGKRVDLKTIMHYRVSEEVTKILSGEYYDLIDLIDTFNTYPNSLRTELREALMMIDSFCVEDIQ